MDKEDKARQPRVFHNFTLGIPSSEGVGQVTREIMLQKCFLEFYPHQETGQGTVMGVDIGNVKYAVVSEVQKTGLVDSQGMEIIKLRVIHLEKTPSWSRIGQLMHIYGVEVGVIDASPERDMARNLANEFPGRIYCVDYAGISEPIRWKGKEPHFILAHRTQTLSLAADSIIKGYVQLYSPPDNEIDDVQGGDALIQHWENLRLVSHLPEETRDGQPAEEWQAVGADHYAHAFNYCYIAAYRLRGPVSFSKAVAGLRTFTSRVFPQAKGPKRKPSVPGHPPGGR